MSEAKTLRYPCNTEGLTKCFAHVVGIFRIVKEIQGFFLFDKEKKDLQDFIQRAEKHASDVEAGGASEDPRIGITLAFGVSLMKRIDKRSEEFLDDGSVRFDAKMKRIREIDEPTLFKFGKEIASLQADFRSKMQRPKARKEDMISAYNAVDRLLAQVEKEALEAKQAAEQARRKEGTKKLRALTTQAQALMG